MSGNIPADSWNRVGTRLIPKLRSGEGLEIAVTFRVGVNPQTAAGLQAELWQILDDLGLGGGVQISEE